LTSFGFRCRVRRRSTKRTYYDNAINCVDTLDTPAHNDRERDGARSIINALQLPHPTRHASAPPPKIRVDNADQGSTDFKLVHLLLDGNLPGSEPYNIVNSIGRIVNMACTQFNSRQSDVPFAILATPTLVECVNML
jgi:hypothetical protein